MFEHFEGFPLTISVKYLTDLDKGVVLESDFAYTDISFAHYRLLEFNLDQFHAVREKIQTLCCLRAIGGSDWVVDGIGSRQSYLIF